MKKLLSILLIAVIALTSGGCAGATPLPDFVQSNGAFGVFDPIMKGENGYFFNRVIWHLSLNYYDNATGKTVYLCNKPECLHDGNEFCAATKESFSLMYSAFYDGSIYLAGYDRDENSCGMKLLRAGTDGTELSEVCTYSELSTDVYAFYNGDGMVIHRGKAFIPYFITDMNDAGKCFAYVVDIKSGASKKVLELDAEKEKGPVRITASGDYFYYATYEPGRMENSINNVWRCDLNGENIEEMKLTEGFERDIDMGIEYKLKIGSFVVIDGKIYYTRIDGLDESWYYIYDPATDKTELFDGRRAVTENGEEILEPDLIFKQKHKCAQLSTDGKYLYIADYNFGAEEYMLRMSANRNPRLGIYSLDGKTLLGSVSYDLLGLEYPEESGINRSFGYSMNVLDGVLYFQTGLGVLYCPIDDIIGGKTEWRELYKYELLGNFDVQ